MQDEGFSLNLRLWGLFEMIVGVLKTATLFSRRNPMWFFLWGYVKDQIYVSPLPTGIPELKVRIRTAIETITADMLQTVWKELDYHVDVCGNHKGCTYRAPVRYVTKTWSILLNKKIHTLLSQVYCVWQVVKTPTTISNNPVHEVVLNSRKKRQARPRQTRLLSTRLRGAKPRPASPYRHVRYALFWDITQYRMVIPHLHFGTNHWSLSSNVKKQHDLSELTQSSFLRDLSIL